MKKIYLYLFFAVWVCRKCNKMVCQGGNVTLLPTGTVHGLVLEQINWLYNPADTFNCTGFKPDALGAMGRGRDYYLSDSVAYAGSISKKRCGDKHY